MTKTLDLELAVTYSEAIVIQYVVTWYVTGYDYCDSKFRA